MQFGQPRQEKFDKRPKCFAPCPKIKIGRCFSEKNEAPQKVPMVTLIAVLTTLPNKSEEKPSSFCSMFENDNGIFLQEKIYSQKVPTNLFNAVLKFWKPIGNLWTKSQKLFAQCPKTVNKHFFQKQMICLKMFLWWHWLRFSKPDRTSSKNSRVVLTELPKKIT